MSSAWLKLQGASNALHLEVNAVSQTVQMQGKRYDLGQMSLAAPVHGSVYGVALNYRGALAALEERVHGDPYKQPPKAAILYIKPVNTMIGYGRAIPLPAGIAGLEMGAALGIVFGRTAVRVSEAEALDFVAGYTVVNDVSVPHSSLFRPAVSHKCRDGFCPIGPWVIERDAVHNPDALSVRVWINGELRQENTTANLIRSVPRLIADITEFMTLSAGDVLLVGVPENAPVAKAGDRVRIEVESVGSLENTIVERDQMFMEGLL
jgi:5-oxopent-3-ene-1,2,5-tricarboxylate decarboxylase/2-hydroxyhepta-2,4-diene-1,7-dioate isomerase